MSVNYEAEIRAQVGKWMSVNQAGTVFAFMSFEIKDQGGDKSPRTTEL